ncbi:hypothetical protein CLV56_2819 [Mumia flava]|uniref:Uncharacterized protein n=1 Tax=Mumia flava TaxID=1348852 RepID=A0A0B2B3T5_9ACTN|nr:hypothetical protein CLV56_2819 [Mumia flava]
MTEGRTLVRIRHKRCGRVLAEITEATSAQGSTFAVLMCEKCERPSPARVAAVAARKGADGLPITREIPWAELRPFIADAKRTGKTVDVVT